MGLQNRVSPDGSLHSNDARGMFTGNRGIIHDPDTKQLLGRRWSTSAWICCSLEWKGRRRDVWGRNYQKKTGEKVAGWSELFFLDEVSALAAGHRPCHTCRNKDAKRFHEAYCAGNGIANATTKNKQLHAQRWYSAKQTPEPLAKNEIDALPDGTIIQSEDACYAIKNHTLLNWTFTGYEKPIGFDRLNDSTVYCVTPKAMVATLKQGYLPLWHSTAS